MGTGSCLLAAAAFIAAMAGCSARTPDIGREGAAKVVSELTAAHGADPASFEIQVDDEADLSGKRAYHVKQRRKDDPMDMVGYWVSPETGEIYGITTYDP